MIALDREVVGIIVRPPHDATPTRRRPPFTEYKVCWCFDEPQPDFVAPDFMNTSNNPRQVYGAVTAGLHLGSKGDAVEDLHERVHRTLSLLALEAPLEFGFRWQGVLFTAAVERVNERHVLSVSGTIRVLPYTAEDSGLRRRLLELIARESDQLASRSAITRDHARSADRLL
jgi:hypothetical protein